MTALQQLLFDYALEHYFSFFLTDGEYRECDACAARQIDALKARLSREEWKLWKNTGTPGRHSGAWNWRPCFNPPWQWPGN